MHFDGRSRSLVAASAERSARGTRAPIAGTRRFVERVATTFYRRMALFAQTIGRSPAEAETSSGLELRDLAVHELGDYLRLRSDQTEPDVRARLARGDRCRIVRAEGRIVHAGWLARGLAEVPYLHARLVLTPGELYSYDSFTVSGWRGRGIAPAWHLDLLRGAAGPGSQRLLALVALENRSGLRVFAKLGYRRIGGYTFARCGPWRRWWTVGVEGEAPPTLQTGRGERSRHGGTRSTARDLAGMP